MSHCVRKSYAACSSKSVAHTHMKHQTRIVFQHGPLNTCNLYDISLGLAKVMALDISNMVVCQIELQKHCSSLITLMKLNRNVDKYGSVWKIEHLRLCDIPLCLKRFCPFVLVKNGLKYLVSGRHNNVGQLYNVHAHVVHSKTQLSCVLGLFIISVIS